MRTLYSSLERSTSTMSFYTRYKSCCGGSAARKSLAVNAQNRNDSEYNDDNDESSVTQIRIHYHNVF